MCTHIHSLSKGTVIQKHVLEPKKALSKNFCDLNYMDWYLEWEKVEIPSDTLVSLALKFVPQPGFADKLSSVLIMLGVTLHSGDRENPVAFLPFDSTIRLTKELDYRFKIVHGKKRLPGFKNDQPVLCNVSLNNFHTCVFCEVAILYMDSGLDELYTCHKLSHLSLPNTIGKDLKAVLSFDATEKQKNFSDISLVVSRNQENKEDNLAPVTFPVHKAILAARSPVFAKMFEHEMQESLTSRVELSDIDPEVVKEMLVYIYTGRVPKIEEMANDLLYVADKYKLHHLKSLCKQHLTYKLQVNNAARIIQLAYLHNAWTLRKNALQFISMHVAEVRATKEWEEVKQGNEMLDDLIEMMQEPPAKRPKTN